jgi:hypothetical protein
MVTPRKDVRGDEDLLGICRRGAARGRTEASAGDAERDHLADLRAPDVQTGFAVPRGSRLIVGQWRIRH